MNEALASQRASIGSGISEVADMPPMPPMLGGSSFLKFGLTIKRTIIFICSIIYDFHHNRMAPYPPPTKYTITFPFMFLIIFCSNAGAFRVGDQE